MTVASLLILLFLFNGIDPDVIDTSAFAGLFCYLTAAGCVRKDTRERTSLYFI